MRRQNCHWVTGCARFAAFAVLAWLPPVLPKARAAPPASEQEGVLRYVNPELPEEEP